MIGQALQVKSIIEKRKSTNELGHLVWQLNEIWPTGTCVLATRYCCLLFDIFVVAFTFPFIDAAVVVSLQT